jgi:DNA modification methylase
MAQENLFTDISENLDKGPVICLGKTFHSEEERREYFRNELRIKLPELKEIEGFPIGEDEDIINLSDPPYYTACPNPWLNDFIEEWEKEKEKIKGRNPDFHVDEPYASDVSVGKNNPIYMAHSYHTKVPHPAIMRYILHYTEPGDVIYDGFAGTGMTGVAAAMCEMPDEELKYAIEQEFKSNGIKKPIWGKRRAICGDLSPIASFISYNYNTPQDAHLLSIRANELIDKVSKECAWLFETKHSNGKSGYINYTVWSEVFLCPNCTNEIVYWDVAADKIKGKMKEEFLCPTCKSNLNKQSLDKCIVTVVDFGTNEVITKIKSIPALINYTFQGKRYEKQPDQFDFELVDKIDSMKLPNWFPVDLIMNKGEAWGDTWRAGIHYGTTRVHHFYTKRNLWAASCIWAELGLKEKWNATNFLSRNLLRCNRYVLKPRSPEGEVNGPMSGTLYIPSESVEQNAISLFQSKLVKYGWKTDGNLVETSSATDLSNLASESIDYIFTDPPFGDNIMYSELNFINESWIKVKTCNTDEAIQNDSQGKTELDYGILMSKAFLEYYRVLKPGKWMTVEFSNTRSAIWTAIQNAIQKVGFVIANVSALDKKHGGIKAMTYTTSVKQDLVISCYKPSARFAKDIKLTEEDVLVWDFVLEHFNHLPVHLLKNNSTNAIIERSPKIIYDRLIAFYFMRGLQVPIDARDFQEGLKQKFVERDGMFFTAEQVIEYDTKKAKAPKFIQMSLLVTSESEGIEWLKNELKQPQTASDLYPKWMKAISSIRKSDILPELKDILNESFIQEKDGKWRTPDPNEAKDREALRTKVLLKEFTGYVTAINQPKAKKLKEVRVEALRAGFKNRWEQKDFKTIVTLGDKIPQNILLEDEQLLMYYDIAKDRE